MAFRDWMAYRQGCESKQQQNTPHRLTIYGSCTIGGAKQLNLREPSVVEAEKNFHENHEAEENKVSRKSYR